MIPEDQVRATQGWLRNTMYLVREGGTIAIPRTGLVFRKTAPRELVLLARMPYDPAMEGTVTPEELAAQQQWDFDVLREVAATMSIEVTDRSA